MVKKRWTKEEIKKLKELYPDNFNIDIAKQLGKTKSSVDSKGYRFKLKKSPKLLYKKNKMGVNTRIINGEFNEYDYGILKNIASKYKTKIDFIRNDEKAYQAARYRGILNDICQHMSILKFSVPQLILREITDSILNTKSSYNDRKIIKPYEIDVFYEQFNLGFEYQGIVWHLNNKNDVIKSKMLKDKKVNIIYIIEYENSRDYEKDIKKQLIENLSFINNVTNKNISKSDILNCGISNIYQKLYNKDELLKISKNYKTFDEFKVKEKSVYRKLLKLKLVDEATSHMKDKVKINKISEKDVINIIKRYTNLSDFRKNELNIYKHIKSTKKDYLLSNLKRKKQFSIEEINNTISKYDFLCDFIKGNYKMYRYIKRNKITITRLKDCRN